MDTNIGYFCSARQIENNLGYKQAFRFIKIDGTKSNMSYFDLEQESNRFANLLSDLGLHKGDAFFTFMPKCREQVAAFIGSLKKQLITGTLFANFGEEAVYDRLSDARAKAIITKRSLYKRLEPIWDSLSELKYIILIDVDEQINQKILSYQRLISNFSTEFKVDETAPDTPSVLHYTSGSTGKPKGVLHRHHSLVMQTFTTQEVLQLNRDDIFWCTADPGWVTGTSYGIIGPCSLGISQVAFEGGMNAKKWFEILEQEQVTVWYTSPTALRMIMQEKDIDFTAYDLSKLRSIFSVGEPLNPEILYWSRRVLGRDIYDTYWQTETGAIMVANRPGLDIKPGSMAKPVGKIQCEIIDDEGNFLPYNKPGNLCIKAPWESMFITYLNNPQVYEKKFRDGYYYTGDQAYRTEDGYFWFIGRIDDIINTAGHLVSPFEVESALLEMEQIIDVAVIGVPDPVVFEKIVAYVKLKSNVEYDAALDLNIRLHVSKKVSPMAAPAEIKIAEKIPKNKSGKIMRRYLRALYEGKDPGDLSTIDQ